MRVLTTIAIGCLVVALAACGPGDTARPYGTGDIEAIVSPKPNGTPFDVVADAERTGPIARRDLSRPAEPIAAPLDRSLKSAGFERGYEQAWSDGFAAATAFLFRDTAGAHDALAAFRKYNRRFLTKIKGDHALEVPSDGLGEEAYGTKGSQSGRVDGVEFGWRRRNLVLLAIVACTDGCNFDVVRATRAYADAVDKRARG